jgi:hypothetical protein
MGLETLGTPDDPRETNPNAPRTTIAKLLRGMLSALQGRLTVSSAPSTYAYVDPGTASHQLGAIGAVGDTIVGILLVPINENAGYVTIKDGAGPDLPVMAAGVLADLSPIWLPMNMASANGGWKITTGGNVAAWVIGDFT